MAKRRGKKTVQKTESLPEASGNRNDEPKESRVETQQAQFADPEVERQVAAIRAVRDVEVEHLLTELRLLRSYFSKEQLQTPVLEFFKESLPNLSIVNDKENKKFEVRWNNTDSRLSMSCAEGRDVHASLLQRLSMAFPDCSAAIPPLGGFEYSGKAGRTSFLGSDNMYLKDFSLEEPSEAQTLAMQEALQTPGVRPQIMHGICYKLWYLVAINNNLDLKRFPDRLFNFKAGRIDLEFLQVSSQRLSVGMTPKTLRLPKPGEMLLSVHGSPLGVYKENNMEAINESEEG